MCLRLVEKRRSENIRFICGESSNLISRARKLRRMIYLWEGNVNINTKVVKIDNNYAMFTYIFLFVLSFRENARHFTISGDIKHLFALLNPCRTF